MQKVGFNTLNYYLQLGKIGIFKPFCWAAFRYFSYICPDYIDFLKNNQDFDTNFYDVGDGLSVSVKKHDK